MELQVEQNIQKGLIDDSSDNTGICWICYDSETRDYGPLIHPCQCRGDVSSVHHDCLRRWLVESSIDLKIFKCKVCQSRYDVEYTTRLDWRRGITCYHWIQIIAIFTSLCITFMTAWLIIHHVKSPIIHMVTAGSTFLISYVFIKCLGWRTVVAYQRAKISSLHIVSSDENSHEPVIIV